MNHLAILQAEAKSAHADLESSLRKATGRYYTHPAIGARLVDSVWKEIKDQCPPESRVRIVDPFAGDGRLVNWLIERSNRADLRWDVHLWDLDDSGFSQAEVDLSKMQENLGLDLCVELLQVDSFRHSKTIKQPFDVVITNPPWDRLKPDRRELRLLRPEVQERFVSAMRDYDQFLAEAYPLSQPRRKFAGWGTNLARVGTELAVRMLRDGGVAGIVSPASLLADAMTEELRRWLLRSSTLCEAAYYPAEARLFPGADVSTVAVTLKRDPATTVAPKIAVFDRELSDPVLDRIELPDKFLEEKDHIVPISFGAHGIRILQRLSHFPTFGSLESDSGLWAGRELDETGISQWLSADTGEGLFVKGRMVQRFRLTSVPSEWVRKEDWTPPQSIGHTRIVWRDVSRPSQKRRIIATLIPKGWIAGNSLGVAYFKDDDDFRNRALLGLMSSIPFEYQLRSFLATGHVSLGALRKVHLPPILGGALMDSLVAEVGAYLDRSSGSEARLEALAAHLYEVSRSDLRAMMDQFSKVKKTEQRRILEAYETIGLMVT